MAVEGMSRRQFMTASGSALALGLGSEPRPAEAGTEAATPNGPRKPNLLIFMPDQLRAESIGCYGHPLVQTPHVDRLAAEGVRFENCICQYPVCTASRCSMFTGWYPHVRGHRSVYYLLRPDEPNLLRSLKRGGYDVYWYGKNDVLLQERFGESATHWGFFAEGPEWSGKDNPWSYKDPRYFTFLFNRGRDRRDYPDYARVRAAIDVLKKRNRDKPFCLFLPLFFPHPPFSAPQGFHDRYAPEDVPALRKLRPGKPDLYRAIHKSRRLDRLPPDVFRKINAVYLGMISYIDWLLGEVLEALERTGHRDDTAVFFCSDHGEWAGDYGLVEKWSSAMDDALVRVPLIVRMPKGVSGQVSGEMVELFDLMATCLEMAGLRPQHTHFARGLLPQLQGRPGDPERAAFTEGGYNPYEPQCYEPLERFGPTHIYYPKIHLENTRKELISRTTTMRTRDCKLVLRPDGQSEFYDLRKDPGEEYNLIRDKSYESRRERMKDRMLSWYIRTSDVVPKGYDERHLPPYRKPA